MKKRLLLIISIITMSIMLLTSCGSKNTESKKTEVNKSLYPMKITDSYNREVTLEKKPERIISIAPNITETIAALNAESKLVGRTEFCDYPESIKSVESIGTLSEPNIEKIVELKPDLVIASTHFKKETVQKLEQLNIKVLVLYSSEDFKGAYETIEKVAKAIGEEEAGTKIVSDMKVKVEEIANKVKEANKPKVYYVVGFGKGGDYTAGKGTFIDQLITMAGGINVANDVEGWKYSFEKLVEKDPDLMICSKFYDTKAGLTGTDGYKELRAVKEGNLFEMDNNTIDRQGPRLADGLLELAKLIHPELFK